MLIKNLGPVSNIYQFHRKNLSLSHQVPKSFPSSVFSIFRLPYPLSMATTLELKDDRKVSEPQTDLKTVVESEIKYNPFPSTYLSTDATSSS